MSKQTMVIAAVIVVLLIGGFGAYKVAKKMMNVTSPSVTTTQTDSASPTATDTMNSAAPEASSSDSMSVGKVKEFTVTGSNFKFEPSTLNVNKGDTVKIIFNNSAGMHDFIIDEFNAKTKIIQSGATDTITFVADKAGSFQYYCSVGNHRAMGMVGTLVVK